MNIVFDKSSLQKSTPSAPQHFLNFLSKFIGQELFLSIFGEIHLKLPSCTEKATLSSGLGI
jgi:hypothetical protein